MVASVATAYDNLFAQPGDEISSTSEGRHVLVPENQLIHPAHADGLVDKGDPVAFWDAVGVALKSATSAAEHVPVDTEGIWRLWVTNTGLNNFGTIRVGQVLFIDATGIISDNWVGSFAIFGTALQPIDNVETVLLAVKVHLEYPYWFYDPQTGP